MRNKNLLSFFVILGVVILDQWLKVHIKTTMSLGQEKMVISDFFRLHFIENEGMAFGLKLKGIIGKYFLTFFRIIALFFIGWFINSQIKKGASTLFVICLSLIFAGALGNIIDSVFYGVLFEESPYYLSGQEPAKLIGSGGYSGWFQGKVVDMLYFPLIDGYYPSWIPRFGGNHFIFFSPIFNIADSAISIGVILLLLFQRKALQSH